MVALTPTAGEGGLDAQIAGDHLGGILYLGGWQGSDTVESASRHVQQQATQRATRGIRLLVAADQEGGQVQQLTGPGFSTMPSGLDQGTLSAANLKSAARTWGRELSRAGVNVNLAPVADTVPSDLGTANGPIGQYGREYGHDPADVARSVAAFSSGMLAADVEPTVKHFPGIGRITGNTDSTASGITDTTTGPRDPYLEPFEAGIDAGAGLVMMSSATYTRMDPDNPAVFSRKVVNGLLRDDLGYDGVVITDDVGAAAALANVPVGDRATRFIAAGGDIVLTADPATTETLHAAILDRMSASDGFAAKVRASVERVLALKVRMGLADCSG
jgi:beta-N-acetylhexosaminidase